MTQESTGPSSDPQLLLDTLAAVHRSKKIALSFVAITSVMALVSAVALAVFTYLSVTSYFGSACWALGVSGSAFGISTLCATISAGLAIRLSRREKLLECDSGWIQMEPYHSVKPLNLPRQPFATFCSAVSVALAVRLFANESLMKPLSESQLTPMDVPLSARLLPPNSMPMNFFESVPQPTRTSLETSVPFTAAFDIPAVEEIQSLTQLNEEAKKIAPFICQLLVTLLNSFYVVTGEKTPREQENYVDVVREAMPQLISFLSQQIQKPFFGRKESLLDLLAQGDESRVPQSRDKTFGRTVMSFISVLIPWVAYGGSRESEKQAIAIQANELFDQKIIRLAAKKHGAKEKQSRLEKKIEKQIILNYRKAGSNLDSEDCNAAVNLAIQEESERVKEERSQRDCVVKLESPPINDPLKGARLAAMNYARADFVSLFTCPLSLSPPKLGLNGLLKTKSVVFAARALSEIDPTKRTEEEFLQSIFRFVPGVFLVKDNSGNLFLARKPRAEDAGNFATNPGGDFVIIFHMNVFREILKLFGSLENVIRNPLFYALFEPLIDRQKYRDFRNIFRATLTTIAYGLAAESSRPPRQGSLKESIEYFSGFVQTLITSSTQTIVQQTKAILNSRGSLFSFAEPSLDSCSL